MEIAKGVYKISRISNVYIILGDVPTVVDCGDFNDREFVKREIEKIIPLDDVKRVLLTHLHYDHCGAVSLFKKAKIYASAEEVDDFKKDPRVFLPDYFGPGDIEFLQATLEAFPKTLGDLEVIKVPGHTRGSVALLDKKRKLLFSGDTLFDNGIGRTDLPNSVPQKMEESLRKLHDLIKTKNLELCPGHDY
jgi:hydroxyacylglutathione hydrolase